MRCDNQLIEVLHLVCQCSGIFQIQSGRRWTSRCETIMSSWFVPAKCSEITICEQVCTSGRWEISPSYSMGNSKIKICSDWCGSMGVWCHHYLRNQHVCKSVTEAQGWVVDVSFQTLEKVWSQSILKSAWTTNVRPFCDDQCVMTWMSQSSSTVPPQDIIACTVVSVQCTKGLLTTCILSAVSERALSPIQCDPDVLVVGRWGIPRDDPFTVTVSIWFSALTLIGFCMLHSNQKVNTQNGVPTKEPKNRRSDRISASTIMQTFYHRRYAKKHITWSKTKQISDRHERRLPKRFRTKYCPGTTADWHSSASVWPSAGGGTDGWEEICDRRCVVNPWKHQSYRSPPHMSPDKMKEEGLRLSRAFGAWRTNCNHSLCQDGLNHRTKLPASSLHNL